MPSIPFDDNWTLVLKPSKKGKNPPHLKPYQEKMRRIAPICAEETKQFKGTTRVLKFNQCIIRKFKDEKKNEKK